MLPRKTRINIHGVPRYIPDDHFGVFLAGYGSVEELTPSRRTAVIDTSEFKVMVTMNQTNSRMSPTYWPVADNLPLLWWMILVLIVVPVVPPGISQSLCPGRKPALPTATPAATRPAVTISIWICNWGKISRSVLQWVDRCGKKWGGRLFAPPPQQDIPPQKALSPKQQKNQQQKKQLATTKAILWGTSVAAAAMGSAAAVGDTTGAARTTAPAITRVAAAADCATVGANMDATTWCLSSEVEKMLSPISSSLWRGGMKKERAMSTRNRRKLFRQKERKKINCQVKQRVSPSSLLELCLLPPQPFIPLKEEDFPQGEEGNFPLRGRPPWVAFWMCIHGRQVYGGSSKFSKRPRSNYHQQIYWCES